jgi:hypothetical protein
MKMFDRLVYHWWGASDAPLPNDCLGSTNSMIFIEYRMVSLILTELAIFS